MVSEEVLEENSKEIAPILYSMTPKVKKKGRIKRFFSNEDVILVLFSLGAGVIIITLMLIAGTLGVTFPASAWWF
ncbi:MAG: hypothetical protein ACFE9C_08430 [Candidatus Hodarchaeota archaeon]